MLPDLAAQRAANREAMEKAAADRKRGYARARLGFKLLCAPVVFGAAFIVYQCGYWVGWMDGIASLAK